MIKKFVKKIFRDNVGNVLAITSVAAPVVIGFAGLSIDVGYALYAKSKLQTSVETTALDLLENYTAPNNFTIENAAYLDQAPLIDKAIELSKGALPENHGDVAIQSSDIEMGIWNVEDNTFTPDASGPIVNAARVKGELSAERNNTITTFFSQMFGFNPTLKADTVAIAPIIPSFHFLNPNRAGALIHSNGSQADKTDLDIGDIWINSDAANALFSSNVTGTFGATGAYIKGGSTGFHKRYYEDLFRLPDLMAEQPEPEVPASCDSISHSGQLVFNSRVINTSKPVTLSPGIYCGGLFILQAQSVTFQPGTYHFVNGPLAVILPPVSTGIPDQRPVLRGRDVLFHFSGNGAAMNIRNAQMHFSGRQSGEHAGIFVFSDRTTTNSANHFFITTKADTVGLFYAPDNPIVAIRSIMNGNCHSLCVVADSLIAFNGTYFNWYSTLKGLDPYLKDEPRIAPTALQPYLKPYLISS